MSKHIQLSIVFFPYEFTDNHFFAIMLKNFIIEYTIGHHI